MSRTSKALDTLTELARDARDQAGQLLAHERKNETQIKAQQETLMEYRQEYAAQLQKLMLEGVDPVTLHNYRQFLMSLDSSIEKAGQALYQQQGRVNATKEQWQQQQKKLSSYSTLGERRAAQERKKAQRIEQNQTDDMTTTRHSRKLRQLRLAEGV